jgi:hypothetical protein
MQKSKVADEEIIYVEVSSAMIAWIVVFWVVTLCSLVGTYHCFGATSCLYLQDQSAQCEESVQLHGRWPFGSTGGGQQRQGPDCANRKTVLFRATVHFSSQ